jgi:hypothetical protein
LLYDGDTRIEPRISIALELCDQSQSVAGTLGGAPEAFAIAGLDVIWRSVCFLLESLPLPYPVLELSNNSAENAIRPVALGRRNWIHIGSKEAGPRVAAIISVVETCRRLKIPVRDYLGSVLPGLGDFPISRIAELTPAAWATRN